MASGRFQSSYFLPVTRDPLQPAKLDYYCARSKLPASASSRCANRHRAEGLQGFQQSFRLLPHRLGGIHGPLEAKTSQRIQNPEHSLPVREPDRLDAGGELSL